MEEIFKELEIITSAFIEESEKFIERRKTNEK